jgi:hypothetical protein
MRTTLARFMVLAGVGALAAGCGDGTTPGSVDAGIDSGGSGHDAGTATDGGPRTDAGPGSDGGPGRDGGPGVDAGADGGSPGDDAGSDAAIAADAGNDAAVVAIDGGPGSCSSDTDCPAMGGTARFCMFPVGACGGTGTCTDTGGFCTGLFMPVCGCDGRTYSNAGCATQMGASIDYTGACAVTTGCTNDAMCAGTEFCDFTDGSCGGTGTCTSRGIGRLCVTTCAPECGCDGNWYRNSCLRDQAGTSEDATGMCRGAPPCTPGCGCVRDRDCAATEECVSTSTGGRCETKMARPACWRDADCARGQTCVGASVCACGAACFAADMPGTCT